MGSPRTRYSPEKAGAFGIDSQFWLEIVPEHGPEHGHKREHRHVHYDEHWHAHKAFLVHEQNGTIYILSGQEFARRTHGV